ncbi:MAG: InlB B-repeat-containing protein [Clostridia bacterium]|nr:InlB B-repeat-containing protein [Clostridia bacterium]
MKLSKRILSLLLSLVLLAGMLSLFGITATAAYKVGDVIEYGTYPQTRIADTVTVPKLENVQKDWKSLGYYSAGSKDSDGKNDGTMTAKSYWQYCDFFYGTDKYRAIRFTAFRPENTNRYADASSTYGTSYVNKHGYKANIVYYFKFEPIKWKVLDPSTGLVFSQMLLDAQPMQNVLYYVSKNYSYTATDKAHYGNDYAFSSIHTWLQEDFMNTAFTSAQKSNVKSTALTGSAASLYSQAAVSAKVFLLSSSDVKNTAYGFGGNNNSDTSRTRKGTDYAASQGLYYDDQPSAWWLRSVNAKANDGTTIYTTDSYDLVGPDGSLFFARNKANLTYGGICPAMCLSTIKTDTAAAAPTALTVTFNANGGTVTPTSKTVYNGNAYGDLPTATKTGSTFLGWAKTSSATAPNVYSNTLVSATGNHTLYAVYKTNPVTTVTVTFDPQGGEFHSHSQYTKTLTIGANYSLPTPDKENSVFAGWYDEDGNHITPSTKVTRTTNHTLYARWVPLLLLEGYQANRNVDYRTTITFHAEATSLSGGDEIHWFINDIDQGKADASNNKTSITLNQVKEDFSVQAKIKSGNGNFIGWTERETIHVNDSFFNKLIAFFKGLFGSLPIIDQK